MTELFGSDAWTAVTRAAFILLFDLAVKGALVLALAGVATVLLRRASAATRHLVWCLALCSVLILPVCTVTLPAWRLPVLAEAPYVSTMAASLYQASMPQAADEAGDVVLAAVPDPSGAAPGVEAVRVEPSGVRGAHPGVRPINEGVLGTFARLFEAVRPVSWTIWILLVWVFGVVVVSSRFLIGALGVGWLAYRARPLRDPAWTRLSGTVRASIRLRRHVRLLSSPDTAMPMTGGLLRPVVLLPVHACAWSPSRRRCVLTHELAHIKRWDCLTQTLAQMTCALNWFNPLVWVAARRMRYERELACDDYVLSEGIKPSDYAAHLLAIARTTRTTLVLPLGAVAMAQPSQLESRIVSILDATRKHGTVHRFVALAGGIGTALLVLPLAALRPADPGVSLSVEMLAFEPVTLKEGSAYRWAARAEPGTTLEIRNAQGRVQATHAEGNIVEVLAVPRDSAFAGGVLVVRQGEALVVCLPRPGHPGTCRSDAWPSTTAPEAEAVDFVARVPAGISFTGQTITGAVTVVGLRSDVSAVTAEGDIFVQTTGRVDAEAVEGNIQLRTAQYGRAITTRGNIHARIGRTDWEGRLPFHSTYGDIVVDLPPEVHTDVDLYVEAEGHLQTAVPMQRDRRGEGEHFQGTLGRGGRLLALHTVVGNITVMHQGRDDLRRRRQDFEVQRPYHPDPVPSRARKLYAAVEKAADEDVERSADPSPEMLADLTIEADLERLRRRIGRLDRTISRHAFETALQALSALDFEVDVDAQVLDVLMAMLDPDDVYAAQMTGLDLGTVSRGDLVLARLVGVDAAYVRSLQAAGYRPTLNELVRYRSARGPSSE